MWCADLFFFRFVDRQEKDKKMPRLDKVVLLNRY